MLLSVPAALLCMCDSDLQHHCCQSPARVSANIFAPLMRMLETCTHSASRCICIHIGYLLVLVPCTKCVCVCVCARARACVRACASHHPRCGALCDVHFSEIRGHADFSRHLTGTAAFGVSSIR